MRVVVPLNIRGLLILVVALGAFALTGCAAKKPVRTVRVAVLDGRTDFAVPKGGEIQDVGWWFGARDRYLSSNLGIILGEELTTELAKVPGVEVHPREDLRIYMAQKERALKRNYPQLDSAARKDLLTQQDPVDFGRSLNVDYVVTSDVIEAKTVTNRTFSFWYSTIDVIVQVYDVSKGELVWTRPWSDTDILRSQASIAQECARKTARKARSRDVFLLTVPR
ncbi:MAG TPA: hypothetical protein PKD58_00200 [Candidatus Sumerlaeota bacterium]|nr:hypothetical protein [Candidatus Sumerlaeota bacterium]